MEFNNGDKTDSMEEISEKREERKENEKVKS